MTKSNWTSFSKFQIHHNLHFFCVNIGSERKFELEMWHGYVNANKLFADVIKNIYKTGDVVWVHDFHLMVLPALLRRAIRDAE